MSLAETKFSSAPKTIDIFLSEKLSISISNSITIQDFLPIPLSLSILTLFILNVFLFPLMLHMKFRVP